MLSSISVDLEWTKGNFSRIASLLINGLMQVFKAHRRSAQVFSQDIFPDAISTADELGIYLNIPGRCAREVHRPNAGGTVEDYYRKILYICRR